MFSSTSSIIFFFFVKGKTIVHLSYLPLRAEAKITDIEDTLKWKQVEKSSFFYLSRHLKKLKHTFKNSIYLLYFGKYKVQVFCCAGNM